MAKAVLVVSKLHRAKATVQKGVSKDEGSYQLLAASYSYWALGHITV